MNSTLTVGSLSGTLVSDDEQTVTSTQETTFEKEAATRDAIHLRWSSFRIEKLFEGILSILTVAYGAVGFGAILLFYTLRH